jgi:nitroimidazol reductase NimA-like FMN-containing flavoprotein (pyridoxamine 5'-phosphate oxidase superfamily)
MEGSGSVVGLEVLSEAECLGLLSRGCVGRVGFVVGGRPQVLPVNYAADERGVVVFRTAATSLLTAVAHQPVAFEIDGVDPAHRTGWSVAVQGQASELAEPGTPAGDRLRSVTEITGAPGQRDRWFAIEPEIVTGRRLPVHGLDASAGWYEGILG